VPQGLSADGDLTGYENLLLSAKLYAIDSHRREAKIQEVLSFLGLAEFGNKLVNSYSGGMIRRLEIGQALLHEPPVLFLDEPTVGLDPAAHILIWNHIRAWQKKYKTTILMTTQDMQEADSECDLLAFMHHGQIVALDTPETLKKELHSEATLADVFIHHTGASIQKREDFQRGDFQHVRKIRRTLSRLG
jgi:ABC-2 type transport system ATP-binding protein